MKTRILSLYSWFEKRLNPYPDSPATQPPTGFFSFLWFCTQGMRGMLLVMSLFTAAIGVFDAVLFSMLGSVIDWLVGTQPGQLWQEYYGKLLMLVLVLFLSPLLVMSQSMLKYSGLASNFPMRLRWNFHHYLLGQSLNFYQNEFAGRIATKVMQTALAVREAIMLMLEILVFISVNFISMVAVIALFDVRLIWPFLIWAVLYGLVMKRFIPSLGKTASDQADARSLMTGRVTDAYINISTVKLFSHSQREAHFVRGAMQEFLTTAYRQMRLISGFKIVNHALNMLFLDSTAALALWFWSLGECSIGAVQDGIGTLACPVQVVDAKEAKPLVVQRGEIRFESVNFAYSQDLPVISQFTLTVKPGERVGLVGRSGAGKSTIVNLLLRFYDLQSGRITIDGVDIAQVTQDSLRSQIGMVTQDTSLLHRSVRDNLIYGKPDSSEQELIAAAKQAQSYEFIQQLYDGTASAF